MNKIKWCSEQKAGIKLIEPNSDLAEAYIIKAEEALESMRLIVIKDWKISTAYYTLYFALYAVLTKIGIKSEIHSCTIEFAKIYLNEYLTQDELDFIEKSLKARVNTQYYTDGSVPDKQYSKMLKDTPNFLVKCKSILIKLTEQKINDIRTKLLKDLKYL